MLRLTMNTHARDRLLKDLAVLRERLERAFRSDTAAAGYSGSAVSAGHCAAVAAIVHELLGGEFVSTTVHGQSHWLNRLYFDGQAADVDLTGDQFERPP